MVWARHVCSSHATKNSSLASSSPPSVSTNCYKWPSASTDWIMLNMNGAMTSLGHRSAGGLLRDAEGSWITRLSRAIRMIDALQAELWATHDDLIFAWWLGINYLQLQTDNLLSVNLLKKFRCCL
ncbi:hypothetical protein V6N13_071641 [Hibiscus sabdariffa]